MKLLTDPDTFFTDTDVAEAVWKPAAIVLVSGALNLSAAAILVVRTSSATPQSRSALQLVGAGVGLLAGLFGVVFLWFLYSGVFHTLALLVDGSGEFRSMFLSVGWGYYPSIIEGVLTVATTVYVLLTVRGPEMAASVTAFVEAFQRAPAFDVLSALGVAFALWRGFVWTFAVKNSHDLSLRNAALVVAIPLAISVAWTVVGLL